MTQETIAAENVDTIDVADIQAPDKDVLKRAANRRLHIMAELAGLDGKVKGLEEKLETAKQFRAEKSAPLGKELAELSAFLAPHLADLRREAQEAHDANLRALS